MATSLNALVLKIGADTSGVSKAVKTVRGDVNRVNSILRSTATDTDKARQATESLNKVFKTGALSQKEYARAQEAIRKRYGTGTEAANRYARSLKKVSEQARRTRTSLKAMIVSTKGLVFAGAGLLGVARGISGIKTAADDIDKLAKTSDKLGIATEKLTALRLAAEETGVSTATLDMAMQRMVRRVAEAGQGTGEAQGALRELGLDAKRLAELSPDQQMKAIADAMQGVTNKSDKLRIAFKLFDSEGAALVNTLAIGRDGLTQYEEEARRLGITVSRFDARQVEEANDAFARMKLQITGVFNKITISLAPAVKALSKQFDALKIGSTITGAVTNKWIGVAVKGHRILCRCGSRASCGFYYAQIDRR